MNKDLIKKLLCFLVIYIICFVYSFFFTTVYNDEIWNYGFSYNIASGLVPYRDFNLVVTPLYSILASIFIKIFGSYLFSFHLFNSAILTFIILIFYKNLKYKSFILIPLLGFIWYPSYNILIILIMLMILNSLDSKNKFSDCLIGVLVGVMFCTKQHIGLCLLLPLLYYSRNKIKSLIGFCIPILVLMLYLIINDALYEFLNYCFLGLLSFGASNNILFFLPIEIIICLVILYKLIKSAFKEKYLFYVLMYQVVTVPICDDYHFMLGIIPILYYLLNVVYIESYKIKYFVIISLFLLFCWEFNVHGFEKLNFYDDYDSFLYGRNIPSYVHLNEISDYIINNSNDYGHIYFFSKNSYYVKLNVSYKLDKFDLVNNGNMGYNGVDKYLKEINNYCTNNKCMFILYRYEFDTVGITQTNKDIIEYVKDNYVYYDEVGVFDIYVNY